MLFADGLSVSLCELPDLDFGKLDMVGEEGEGEGEEELSKATAIKTPALL